MNHGDAGAPAAQPRSNPDSDTAAAGISSLPGSGRERVATESNAIANAPQAFYRIREETP